MCTAVTYRTKDHYFGRNLDLEYHYDECVTVTPRKFPLPFRKMNTIHEHFAFIGMAAIVDGYPLYYDATNEYGLSICGLNFPGNATYYAESADVNNICPFELVPWILSQCKTTAESRQLLERTNLVNIPFSESLPLSPLHWLISDRDKSIVVEPMSDGLHIMENPVGILTNNPPFAYHMINLTNFINLTSHVPENRFSDSITIMPYSRGMGAIGLPGDLSSASRFVRAAFVKFNSVSEANESASINQFFHILNSVSQQNGCNRTDEGLERTIYSSCCNTTRGIYYYTTYENRQVSAINMHKISLDDKQLHKFPLIRSNQINYLN